MRGNSQFFLNSSSTIILNLIFNFCNEIFVDNFLNFLKIYDAKENNFYNNPPMRFFVFYTEGLLNNLKLYTILILMIKKIIKKFIPKSLFLIYHRFLAVIAAFVYRWPSRKMIIIGVTGTGGKSTVVNLIGKILEEAGHKVGWTSTMNFRVAEREWLNKTKMTMLGRFALQKLLWQMVKVGCQYAIIETSSEGIVQSRHLGIDYDVAIFTNLSPEHIESHGSFEKYRVAKMKLFARLKKQKPKIIDRQKIKKISVVNLDDEAADYFLKFPADEKYGYQIKNQRLKSKMTPNKLLRNYTGQANQGVKIIEADITNINDNGSEFMVDGLRFKVNLLGEFNVYNALAAITTCLSQDVALNICQRALSKFAGLPGRLETVTAQPFRVLVDYAHTPDSLEKVYQTFANLHECGHKYREFAKISGQNPKNNLRFSTGQVREHSRMICVLGAAGGGRDKWKRPRLGEIAGRYCQEIIITNEDPYDENPEKIIEEVAAGVKGVNLYKILDRREAIKKALTLARPNDLVIITGKGCEQYIIGPNNKKIAWDDREVVRGEIEKLAK